jgi:phosphatidylserine decarboxylase
VKVVQIAGIIARRIVCRAAPGDELARGQKYGIIHFGSRVEVFIPQGKAKILVKNGDKVLAGESIVAQWK